MPKIRHIFSIRGATTLEKNEKSEIIAKTTELYNKILAINNLTEKGTEIVNIMISSTWDVTAFYPAAALREGGQFNTPLFSCQEPNVDYSLPLCIRIMLTVSSTKRKKPVPKHCYLGKAKKLRPDLAKGEV